MNGQSTYLSAQGDEGRYRLLVENIVDYAIYMLDPNGFVVSWNAGAERFKGYPAHEIMGEHFSRLYTEEDQKTGLPARALEIARTEGKFDHEGWRVRKDGTRFWASVIVDPVRDHTGNLVGYAKIDRAQEGRSLTSGERATVSPACAERD
jgi:PAS domain S-box-containing protein